MLLQYLQSFHSKDFLSVDERNGMTKPHFTISIKKTGTIVELTFVSREPLIRCAVVHDQTFRHFELLRVHLTFHEQLDNVPVF